MNLQAEERKLIKSFVFPALIVGLMWLVKGAETVFDFSAGQLGIRPLEASGLAGILLSPFIHGDWNHLFANSIPMLVLPAALFYFYRTLAFRILLFTTLICGFWVWAGAREASHIGASGVIYGLASFLMVSGFLRKENRLMALSLVVVFLYGSSSKIGWGEISLIEDEYREERYQPYFTDQVFVLTPQIEVEANLARWLKVNVGVGYRIVTGINRNYTAYNNDGSLIGKKQVYKSSDFNSPQANVTFIFGWFW